MTWSKEEIEGLHLTQVYTLLLTYTEETRKLAMSRLVRPSFEYILDKSGYT